MKPILLGFEVGTGEPVYIKPGHLVVTGVSQRSGKTTTLEALVTRSNLKAIAFKTKPGETGLSRGKVIPPFFLEKHDWRYVESLLSATIKEKLKFERAWIARACKGAQSLEDVDKNIVDLLKRSKEGSLQYNVYYMLHEYFKIVLPQLKEAFFSKELVLTEGVHIMDLEKFSDEVQALVIGSVMEHVLKNEKDTVVIVPECWKFIPEERGSPVKLPAEALVRQGAARGNFIWLDSQDLAGVDKSLLKQVSNWILGIQLERNEVQHTLDQIPLPKKAKPPSEEIMTLKVGHFFYCSPDMVKKVYVMPSWLDEDVAKKVARGEISVEQVMERKVVKIEELDLSKEAALAALRNQLDSYAKKMSELTKERDKAIEETRRLTGEIKRLQLEVAELKKQRAVPYEDYLELKKTARRYNSLLNALKRLTAMPEVEVPVEVQIPATKTPLIEEVPATSTPVSLLPSDVPQTLTIPPDKNLILQKLGGMPRKIYETLLQHPQGLTKPQIGLMTGYVYTSGSFANAMSKLTTMGLIKREGEIYRVV